MIMKSSSSTQRSNSRHSSRFAPAVVALLSTVFGVVLLAGTASAADPVDAAKLWSKNCQTCHGADGKGKTKSGEKAKVKDLTAADVKSKLTRAKAIEAIAKGVKEEGSDKMAMKAYSEKLSTAEIEALADYSMAFK